MKIKNTFAVINMETGEVIKETSDKKEAIMESRMEITKDMMKDPSIELIKYVYKQMKCAGKIDKFGMIEVDGLFVGEKFFDVGANAGVLAENFIRLKKVLSFRGFIKKTSTTDCKTWTEVWKALGIDPRNKSKVRNMKKLILDNDIVREKVKISGEKVFVVNPNVLRHGTHTSDFCISAFKDVTLGKVHRYNTYLMYLNGLIDFKDLS